MVGHGDQSAASIFQVTIDFNLSTLEIILHAMDSDLIALVITAIGFTTR
jgi:hypothetical protein